MFATRNNPASEFGKKYKQYWDLRDSKEKKATSSRTAQKLQQLASDNTINLAQIAWESIQTQTQIAVAENSSEASTSTTPLNNTKSLEVSKTANYLPSIGIRLSKSSTSLTASSSCYIDSHVDNSKDNKVFEDYFHDINEAIEYSLDGIIDWTVTAAREMMKDKFSPSTFVALQGMCQFKEYEYTPECKSLVDRLSGEDKSVMGWRRELLDSHEFTNKQFDPLKHQDWAYVKFIAEHFLRFMESTTNPLMSSLAERTAISYTIQPIFNHLLLPYAHLFNIKWIEVSNDFTESAKIDGLSILKGSKEILLIVEFAGGNSSSSMAKYESDIKKIYENALKSIKQSGRNKIFTVLYFNNLIYYEVLLKFKKQYVRCNYTISRCPTNPSELQKFVKDTKIMFAWVQDLVAFAKTIA
ncbi:unnamed protein product [Rhizopus stolonifer]